MCLQDQWIAQRTETRTTYYVVDPGDIVVIPGSMRRLAIHLVSTGEPIQARLIAPDTTPIPLWTIPDGVPTPGKPLLRSEWGSVLTGEVQLVGGSIGAVVYVVEVIALDDVTDAIEREVV